MQKLSKITLLICLFAALGQLPAAAQTIVRESDPPKTAAPAKASSTPAAEQPANDDADDLPEAIADNSFLIEEAYNQEPGVMQTIATCVYFRRPTRDVGCTVTQEFPVVSQKHQLGFTLPVSFLDSNRTRGVGDLAINYRYQLTGEKAWATTAPRVSLLLPTGSASRGLGTDSAGVQLNLPVSKRLNRDFTAHFNAGATFLPRVRGVDTDGREIRRSLSFYAVGGSLVWLTHKNFNVVGEYLENFQSEIGETGRVERYREHVFNPGVRFAINLKRLQIVPGVSVPLVSARGERRTGMFFYLSLEHPFKKLKN